MTERQINRAFGALREARLDLWESQYWTDGSRKRTRKDAKRRASRARRKLNKIVTREAHDSD